MHMAPENNNPMRKAQTSPAEVNALIALYNERHYAELENRTHLLIGQYPDAGLLWKLLGASLQMQGKDALPALRNAAKLSLNDAEPHNNLGIVLQERGQFVDAAASYRSALKIDPGFVEAHYNLGNVQSELGQLEDAVISYRSALKINPNFAVIHSNLGNALKDLGQLDAALASYRRALQINPDFAEMHNNLGSVLQDLGRPNDAAASYRQALELKPDYIDAQSSLLFTLNNTASHAKAHCLTEARQYGRMVAKKVTSQFSVWQCVAEPERLRVGMVSGDLHKHPVGYFLENLLARLNPARVELIAYPTDMQVDELTARIKPYFAAWKPLFGLSDEAAARLIHADGVHVLIDLAGHTSHNFLPVFAWKPAPVQASWLGYFATTGMAEMDYLLADEVGVPEAQRKDFSETVWYLPDTRLCFTPPEVELPVALLPALKNGHITFGCFQNLAKVGNEVLTVWGVILSALPSAKLRWQCKQLGDPAVVAQLVERLQQHGINPARVSLHGTMPRDAYLSAHAAVDVILDTFPYPGGTTTCEALWMGVPTLTLAGDTLLARQGASLLTAAGLKDWVATSIAYYIEMAVELSDDLPKLAALRTGLREQVNASPLLDAQRFARNFEDALWGMWQARTQGLRMTHERPTQT